MGKKNRLGGYTREEWKDMIASEAVSGVSEEVKAFIESGKLPTKNPIIDNRIVNDKTFALRLLSFVFDIQCSDPCSDDERTSMISYSSSLLEYQIETATDEEEIDYLKRCNAQKRLDRAKEFLR